MDRRTILRALLAAVLIGVGVLVWALATRIRFGGPPEVEIEWTDLGDRTVADHPARLTLRNLTEKDLAKVQVEERGAEFGICCRDGVEYSPAQFTDKRFPGDWSGAALLPAHGAREMVLASPPRHLPERMVVTVAGEEVTARQRWP